MSAAAFENSLSGVFGGAEQRLGRRLSAEKTRAENLQAQDMRRVAFILTEAIEAELKAAVVEALSAYDVAINRPLQPNERWEEALRRRIGQAVDGAVKLALALDVADHPWKPLLSAEAPKLKSRLLAPADAHFSELGKARRKRRGASDGVPDAVVWIALFAAGLVTGGLAMRLIMG